MRADPLSLRNRLIRTAERQVREIETRLSQPGRAGPERERDVRMLVSVTRALRDLAWMESRGQGTGRGAFAAPEPPQKSADQLRKELAQRIYRLVGQAKAKYPDDTPAGATPSRPAASEPSS